MAVTAKLRDSMNDQSGYIMFMAMFVFFIVTLVGVALIVVGTSEVNLSSRSKMMEQAYALAEAGVDRAVSEIALDRALASSPQNVPGKDYQWTCSEDLPGVHNSHYESSIYFDDNATSNPGGDPFYKIITSTGTYEWGSGETKKEVERTLEVRAYIPAVNQQAYDDAFDYCIFNGFNKWTSDQDDQGPVWPSGISPNYPNDYDPETHDAAGNLLDFYAGNFVCDGSGISEARAPRGAIYTRGNISLTVSGKDDTNVEFKGNVVATNNVTITNARNWRTHVIVSGNVVAGLDKLVAALPDGSGGNATVNAKWELGNFLNISGNLCAGRDVVMKGVCLLDTLNIGGIKAGRDVDIFAGLAASPVIGPITSVGKTVVANFATSKISITSITAGQDDGTKDLTPIYWWGKAYDVGVVLISTLVNGETKIGPITSRGEVVAQTTYAKITLGTITAGNNEKDSNVGGTGVFLSGRGGYTDLSTGDITSTGMVYINGGWGGLVTTAKITAGTDSPIGSGYSGQDGYPDQNPRIGLNTGVYYDAYDGWSITQNAKFTSGDISSVGDVKTATTYGQNTSLGNITTGNDVELKSWKSSGEPDGWVSTISVGSIYAKNDVKADAFKEVTIGLSPGSIKAMGNVSLMSNSTVATGLIMANGNVTVKSTNDKVNINYFVFAGGNVVCEGKAGSTATNGIWGRNVSVNRIGSGDPFTVGWLGYLYGGGEYAAIRATGNEIPPAATVSLLGHVHLGSASPWWRISMRPLPVILETVGDITFRERFDWTPTSPPAVANVAWPVIPVKPAAPTVDMLEEAGLDELVRFPVPNWGHFMELAIQDDGPNPNPDAPHMVYEGGAGDRDPDKAGIQFQWDASMPYSSEETVYNGTDTTLYIAKLVLPTGVQPTFTGTIVSKGPVVVDATEWSVGAGNVLNMISGSDIIFNTKGTLAKMATKANLHLYATRNIIFKDALFATGTTITTFSGSFTAGNKVVFMVTDPTNKNYVDCTFAWSRWALDPVGWIPEFRVLSWREI